MHIKINLINQFLKGCNKTLKVESLKLNLRD